MNYKRVLSYFPYAKAVYGGGDEARTPLAVGNTSAVFVDNFKPTPDSGFGAALYKDPLTGKYTIAFVGSEFEDFTQDWVKTDGVLAAQDVVGLLGGYVNSWGPQMSDALNFAYASVKTIYDDMVRAGKHDITMDDIRAVLDVTGHSLGGALAELVGKFFGLDGANIDGPGVTQLLLSPDYLVFQDKVANDPDLIGFQRDYVRPEGGFVSAGFSFVSMAGEHLPDTYFEAEPGAASSYYGGITDVAVGAVGLNAVVLGHGLITLGMDGAKHPMGTILDTIERETGVMPQSKLPLVDWVGFEEALASGPQTALYRAAPSATTYAMAVEWLHDRREANVAQGLSPSGLPMDGTAVVKGPFSALAFRDPATGEINEVYTPLAGGPPIARKFVVADDGSVGTYTTDGKLQFLVKTADGEIALAELQSDNSMVLSGFKSAGEGQVAAYTLDEASANAVRTGEVSIKQNLASASQAVSEGAGHLMGDGESPAHGHPMGANQLEHDGAVYNVNEQGDYERALSGGAKDIIDAEGHRYLEDAQGERTLVDAGQTIAVSDSGVPLIVVRSTPDAGTSSGTAEIVVHQEGNVVTRTEFGASGELIRTSTMQTFDDGSVVATITLPNGDSQSVITNADGSLDQKSVTHVDARGNAETVVTNGSGEIVGPGRSLSLDDEPLNTDATLTRPDPNFGLTFSEAGTVGLYHWGTLGGYNVLPFSGQSAFLTDNDGELIGEVNELPNGDYQVKYYLTGEAVYVGYKDGVVYGADKYSQRHPGESPPQNPPHVSPYSSAPAPVPEPNSGQPGNATNGNTGNTEPHHVYYTTPGDSTPLTVGVGADAYQIREVVQITSYTDPLTGAQMQTRVPSRLVAGQFEATGGASTTGVDALGRTVLSGDAVATIAAVLTTPSAEATPGVFRRCPRTHTHLDRHNTRHCPGVGTKNPLTSSSK